MALDGIVLSNIVEELHATLINGRIDKIYQIEKDDILLTIRNNAAVYKLLLTANSSYPRLHLSTLSKNMTEHPPMFCMMLRKHLASGKIMSITQPNFERIVEIHIEATNEFGDKESKKLIIEIMGRHSNIILTKENYAIIDSIKHISFDTSSVREVLPGRMYTYPPNQGKLNPLLATYDSFKETIHSKSCPIYKALYLSYSGLSPTIANSLCLSSNVDNDLLSNLLDDAMLMQLFTQFEKLMTCVKNADFTPVLYSNEKEIPVDFYSFLLPIYHEHQQKYFTSISELIEQYYFEKNVRFNMAQKTNDIKKLIHIFIERAVRKEQIQLNALEECKDKERYKIYGELLTSYAYQVPENSKAFTVANYYSENYEEITIPLDENFTPIQNAQKYFKLYNKAKRTEIAAKNQLAEISEDLEYLNSVLVSLDIIETPADVDELRLELIDMGYLKKSPKKIKKALKNKHPYMQFKSSSGFTIYVGKNNYQNDELTMKFAKNNDMWLHIKDGAGSHVIIKADPSKEFDETTLNEAAILAAYYSKGKNSSNVAIDYTLRKNVKKIPNAKPGMVIYTNFKTIFVTPEESVVKRLLVQ